METNYENWADEPIEKAGDDRLGRGDYATHVARTIRRQSTSDSSAVFGMVGPWGSGKTSLLNLVCSDLEKGDSAWQIARFTPWATGDTTSLVQEFYASLRQKLPDDDIKGKLLALAQIAAPVTALLPFVGSSAKGVTEAVLARLTAEKPWDETFREVSAAIAEQPWKVLVVVDDIDRLQPDELLTLLKVVRLLGRFPGVQYLLAYDRATIENGLHATGAQSSTDAAPGRYMEKIVQYPFTVPPFAREDRSELLERELSHLMTERGSFTDRDSRLRQAFQILQSGLETPRALGRFVTSLGQMFDIHDPGEVSDVDTILLTYLRLRSPEMYEAVFARRFELTVDRTRVHNDELLEALLSAGGEPGSSEITSILSLLFPKALAGRGRPFWASPYNGVASLTYIERYYQMGIPPNDVADAKVLGLLRSACEGEASELIALLEGKERATPKVAVEKVSALIERLTIPSEGARLYLIEALAQGYGKLEDDPQVLGPRSRMSFVLASVMASLGPATDSESVSRAFRTLPTLDARIYVLRDVYSEFERDPQRQIPGWVHGQIDELRTETENVIVRRLLNFDPASTENGIVMLTSFLSWSGGCEGIRKRLAELEDSKQLDLLQLAALLVPTMTRLGPDSYTKLGDDISMESILSLAPWAERSVLEGPASDVDVRDLTWGNRQAYVVGRVTDPDEVPKR